ncbi:major capsid protein [Bacillus phage HonestAbe]|uniref:major head protein n=1 Tax=Bacillus phage DIGNKC TaxID=1805948 RepID=UPI0007A7786D|nr:major head protein [Bacillus phage DIGNKC]YP_009280460.1 major head protein [Bacillus phage Belinda]YP_009291665.1 major head protein [Bacillus phage Zuko]AOZ61708.1 major capsid protein [Bacillus phage BJ4]AOZ62336.1 major capsid protein [Bacillus phage SBP8a]ASR79023.1 major capsid protein [Bacillus phage AaronPhadgers]AUV57725.1 major capsid protein [Bacillus phage HonestAbe]AXF41871.1 major capsid protein [Bacillus phage Saddex]UGO46336.1 major capsid protein [Bacillus phage vB_BanH_
MTEVKVEKEKEVKLPEQAEAQLAEIVSKSFTTGTGITPDTQQNAAALRRELLEDQVKMLAFDNADFTIYPMINKQQVNSTVAKYAVFNQHGRTGHSRFVREVGVASINDPNIRQKTVQMKFLSDTKQQSIAAGLVNNIADPMSILTEDAISVIAKSIEWGIFYGDASLSAEDDSQAGLEFDGLGKLIDKETNVIDLAGKRLTEEVLNKAAVIVGKGYGRATDAFMPIGVQADFTNNLLDRQRVIQPSQAGGFSTGFSINQFLSTRGAITLHGSTIMENDNILVEGRMIEPNAPQAPASVVATVAKGKGKFRPEDIKEQSYKVVVHSDDAESLPSQEVIATVAEAESEVKLTVKLANLYQASPQFISVYRRGNETGHYFLIARFPVSKRNDQDELVVIDRNETIPETTDVFVGEMTPQVLSLLELLPMMKLPLAQMNATTTFTVLWYGALALYAPKKWVRIRNVQYIPALAADVTYRP